MRTVLFFQVLGVLQTARALQHDLGVTVGQLAVAVPVHNRSQSLKVLPAAKSRVSPFQHLWSLDFSGVAMKQRRTGRWLQSPDDSSVETDPDATWRLIDAHKKPFSSWFWLCWTLIASFALYWFLLGHLPDTPVCHVTAFLLWLSTGAVFGCVIYYHYGQEDGDYWMAGYLLELGFGFENVMVFNMLLSLLDTPVQQVKRVVLYVLAFRLVFEFVFFLGLADYIRHFVPLPYMLAVWFLYCGVLVLQHDDEHQHGGGHKIITSCSTLFGDRFFPFYDEVTPERLFVVHKDKVRFTLMVPLVGMCSFADFALEVDVVLALIDLIPDGYIAFSSAAMSGFAMLSLIFIMRDIIVRFPQMRYSVSLVFIYFGLHCAAKEFIHIPPLVSCGIVLFILGGFLTVLFILERAGLIGENDEDPEYTTKSARKLTEHGGASQKPSSQEPLATQVSRRSWARSSETEGDAPQASQSCATS